MEITTIQGLVADRSTTYLKCINAMGTTYPTWKKNMGNLGEFKHTQLVKLAEHLEVDVELLNELK